MCGTYLDTYIVLSFVTGFITVFFPLSVFYLSPVEMLSLDPFQGNTPYVLLPCGEELQRKVAFLCHGCAARHSA
jgi:hypothetical protein